MVVGMALGLPLNQMGIGMAIGMCIGFAADTARKK
jgi:uncharacterized membrane protein (Fun14 family)